MRPTRSIRRFDVFAEYRKQDAEDDGKPKDEAKGYGLWVAKVVASRRFGGAKTTSAERDSREGRDGDAGRERHMDGKWHLLSGEAQTDALFDREVVRRMGDGFYRTVFAPAIRDARRAGKSYEDIRDSIRKDWKPESGAV
jgi:hypothetical protein